MISIFTSDHFLRHEFSIDVYWHFLFESNFTLDKVDNNDDNKGIFGDDIDAVVGIDVDYRSRYFIAGYPIVCFRPLVQTLRFEIKIVLRPQLKIFVQFFSAFDR